MAQYWKISTTNNIAHGSDIINKPATITFSINPPHGGRVDVQPVGKILAWHAANQITFETNALISPFIAPTARWTVGQIDIATSSVTTLSLQFLPGNLS